MTMTTVEPQRDSGRQAVSRVGEIAAAVATPQPITIPVLRLERASDGRLLAHRDGKSTAVRVVRCFPWTDPTRYASLRDEKDNEVALVKEARDLDPESRRVFEGALAEAGFVLEVIRIHSMEDLYEVRQWSVETKQGERLFQTKLDEWPRELASGGFVIRDVCGDLYFIAEPERMDAKSRRILWALAE